MKEKQNIPLSLADGLTTPGQAKRNRADFLSDLDPDYNEYDNSMASLETIDAFVGPVKREFNDLKKKIEDQDRQLEKLESDFYKTVSSKALELEGIGPEQEAEIERHTHLYEM